MGIVLRCFFIVSLLLLGVLTLVRTAPIVEALPQMDSFGADCRTKGGTFIVQVDTYKLFCVKDIIMESK